MITVVSPTAIHVNTHAQAIQKTLEALPVPAKGLLISHHPPKIKFAGEWAPITRDWLPRGEWNKEEYCRFLMSGLVDYIDTDHCILVHWDGYAVNRGKWRNEFLSYDYIGAPWPTWLNPARVGNGGFSLRSRKWLEVCSQLPDCESTPEDDWCCHHQRHAFDSLGLRIAPLSVAMKWSIEHRVDEWPKRSVKDTFGFHGFFHRDVEPYRLIRQ